MVTLALLYALTATQPELRITPVDRCEINTVTGPGETFTQVILWRWSHQLKRYIVAEWSRLDSGWHRERGGVIVYRDCRLRLRRVRPTVFRETHGADSEMLDRKLTPDDARVPYFD